MSRCLLIVFLVTMLSIPALAAELGMAVIPKNMSNAKPEDMIEAVSEAKSIKATLDINVFGWGDIEPKDGAMNLDAHLGGLMYAAQQGLRVYFGIAPINTNHKNIPTDLQDAKWTDARLVARFDAVMKGIAARMPRDIPYIVIGNEVDIYFDKHPEEVDDYLKFYKAVAPITRHYFPKAKLGITVTYEGLQKGRTAMLQKIIGVSDAAFFTFYPNIDLQLAPLSDTGSMLEKMIKVAGAKPVVLQEAGYYSSPQLGSSPERQADFFRILLTEVQKRPQIAVLGIFSLHDIDEKLCKMLMGYYGFSSAPTEWLVRFQEAICTLGIRKADGSPKASWFTLHKAMNP